jgi:germination protein M
MMKKIFALVFAFMILLSGCGVKNPKTATSESIDLYYALKGNTGLEVEQRSIEYKNVQQKYQKTLEEWLKGPADLARFEKSTADTVKLLKVTAEQGKLTIDFSKNFGVFNGAMHEAALIAAVVNTMVQFPEIDSVRITVEGAELIAPSGNPYGYLQKIKFDPNSQLGSKEVTLYFADDQALNVVAEKRNINIEENAPNERLIQVIIEELIKGPQNTSLEPTIPAEARVNSVKVNGDRATIDFSQEIVTQNPGGAAGEDMTLTSLANSITEVEGIRAVVLTVNGKPLNIEHIIVDGNNPLTRAEDRIVNK